MISHGIEMETQMVWPHLTILWHGEDNSAGDNERSKTERRRDGKITSRNGVCRFPEGSGRHGRMERYCCNVICDAPDDL